MRIHEFAKVLSKEAGKPVTSSSVLLMLSKKVEGLRATSTIDDDMMNYVRARVMGKSPSRSEGEKKDAHKAPADRKPARQAEKDAKTDGTLLINGVPVGARPAVSKPAQTARTEKKPAQPRDGKISAQKKAQLEKSKEEAAREEAKRMIAERREKERLAEERRLKEEARKKAEEERIRLEEQRQKEEAERKVAEEKAAAENAAKKAEEEKKAAEDAAKKAAEDAAKKAAETAAKKEEEEKKAAAESTEEKPARKEAKEKHERRDGGDRRSGSDRRSGGERRNGDERRDGGDRRSGGERRDGGDRRSGGERRDADRDRRGGNDRRDGDQGGKKKEFERRGDGPKRSEGGRRPAADRFEDKPVEKSGKNRDKSRDRNREETRADRRFDKKQETRNERPGRNNKKQQQKEAPKLAPKKEPEDTIKSVTLPESLTLKELADKIKQPVNAMIKKLFMEGKMLTVNSELSFDDAAMIALGYNYIAEEEEKVDIVAEVMKDEEDAPETLTPRPPVVCVMGHVDHGKTSLLDAIRQTSVTQEEAGGITQHIGAYVVKAQDKKITFLDTPGHEAFTAMRLRGAQSTDIAILVVAADDGVMPQTIEAINHAKAAGIEIIVAVNKIDKPSANIERVKQELVEYGLIAEDWGGSTIFCPVSAHTGEGISNLLDMIILTSEVLELKANKDRKARGVVIEARLDKGRGPVATLLVQKGTLHVGDYVAIGEANGRVRAMLNDKQKQVKEALPSTPVEITGLGSVPNSGDTFIATATEKEARQISDAFITRGKENLIAETRSRMSLDDLFNQMQEGTLKELNLIIKADVQGSVEALKQSLLKLSNDEIIIKCIHSGVGAINESDVTLASASGAIIIGFNVRPDAQAKTMADQEKVDVRLYRVIYNAIDDIESAMKGMLDPVYEEKITGHAEVRMTFKASQIGIIAGCFVNDGVVERNSNARISRGGEQIFDGKIASLKHYKDDVKEAKAGFECGIVFDGFSDLAEGDQIEVYKMVEVPR